MQGFKTQRLLHRNPRPGGVLGRLSQAAKDSAQAEAAQEDHSDSIQEGRVCSL